MSGILKSQQRPTGTVTLKLGVVEPAPDSKLAPAVREGSALNLQALTMPAAVAISSIAPELAAKTPDPAKSVDSKILDAARATAAEQGYKEGFAKGTEAAVKANQDNLKSIAGVLETLDAQRHQLVRESEEDIVTLVFEALAKIWGDHNLSRQTVLETVRQSLLERQDTHWTIRVAAADLEALSSAAHQWKLPKGTALKWVEDPRVTAGGCILENDRGALDARIDIQLARLKKSFLDARHSATDPQGSNPA